MEAKDLILGRRSVRKYKDEKVSRALMTEIVDIARWSPSWANTQIARYTIVDNEDVIARIANEGVHGFAYNMGTLKNAKGVVVLSYVQGKSGKISASKSGGDDMNFGEVWEMFDAGIACQTFCLAAYAKGIGTCIFGVIDPVVVKSILGLPEEETVATVIVYGYPDETPNTTPRKEVEKLIRFV